ncbi:MAG: hypothetical protein HXS44_05215 [Theionarchaea archaeon]|nr:hypothetical protein [Theionarchaea archaeon]
MEHEEKDKERKMTTFTKAALVIISIAIITIFVVISLPLDVYIRAVIVLALIGITAKLTERVVIDIHDLWNIFDFWGKLRR